MPALVKATREAQLPFISCTTGVVGPPIALGASFRDNGYDMALVMIRVLRGESPATIPLQTTVKARLEVDLAGAKQYGVVIPRVFLPDRGTIRIGGTDVTRWAEHQRAGLVGRVFQDPFKGSCPTLTVAENMRMAVLRGGRRGLRVGLNRAALDRYRALLASLGMRLEGRVEAAMGTLSGGQRQAVTLLMATLRRPQLLLLDEHTAALDPRAAEQVMRVTEAVVREQKLTAFMVTHSMAQAVRFGDRTVMMHRGQVIADLVGEERRGVSEDDLLRRFAELRYTMEMRITQELNASVP